MFENIDQLRQAIFAEVEPSAIYTNKARTHNDTLTKPQGSLGKLEDIAIWLASWQQKVKPELNKIDVLIFAGNHGVVDQGVSLFPQEVTEQMVENFKYGGAAINQLSELAGANLNVIPLNDLKPSADFSQKPALSEAELLAAINEGAKAVDENADLICLGEMGIGNTTSAAAICTALFEGSAAEWTGAGTGLNKDGISKKAEIVEKSVALHSDAQDDPLEVLRCLGGFELAGIFGAIMAARHHKIPVLLDGFICSSAAAPLFVMNPSAKQLVRAGHLSVELGHIKLLENLTLEPILKMDMRLGEGSGAALAIQIVKAALATHNGMSSFADAGVSDSF